jgi:competence ComEA-like helix-hairpin-helix protein
VILTLFALSAHAERVDINHATAEVLASLPVLSPTKAIAVVHWRTAHGPCRELDELVAVPGIGAATVAALRERAYCGGAPLSQGALTDTAAFPANTMPEVVDINRASVEELQRLAGMIEPRARAVVAYREEYGLFASCADLTKVPGIGPATVTNITVANLGPACVAR